MRGKRTSPEKIEEIKALSIAFDPQRISIKTGVCLRTVYEVLKRKDNPLIEAKRTEKRLEIVDRVFNETEEEIQKEITTLKDKGDMLLDHLTPEKAAKARVTEITTAYGTLFDKRRALQGKSSDHSPTQITLNVIHNDQAPHPIIIEAEYRAEGQTGE